MQIVKRHQTAKVLGILLNRIKIEVTHAA